MKRNKNNGRLQNQYSDDDILKTLSESTDILSGKTIMQISKEVGSSKRTMERRLNRLFDEGKVFRYKVGCWIYYRGGINEM